MPSRKEWLILYFILVILISILIMDVLVRDNYIATLEKQLATFSLGRPVCLE